MERPKRRRITKVMEPTVQARHENQWEQESTEEETEREDEQEMHNDFEGSINDESTNSDDSEEVLPGETFRSGGTGNWDYDRVEVHEDNPHPMNDAGDDLEKEEDYRLVAYVNFVVSEGLSEKTLDRLDDLMTVLYGESPPFMKRDVMKVLESVRSKFIRKVLYYCHKCSTQKESKFGKCQHCDQGGTSVADTVSIALCDVKLQVNMILHEKAGEIISAHQNIHNKTDLFDLNDIRRFVGYKSLMESKSEFESGLVNLLCTVSSDGARFKRVSRREVTPMLLRLEGIDMEGKTGGGCMIISSLAFSEGGVKTGMIDEYLTRNFEHFNGSTYSISVGGKTFNFKLVILSYLADMKEQYAISGLPNWHNVTGCSKCVTVGQKKRNGKVSYNNFESATPRTDDSVLLAAVLEIDGYSGGKDPHVFKFVPPTRIAIDPFHVRGMGTSKFCVEEIQKQVRWKFAKLKRGSFEVLAKSIENIPPYTYDNVKLLSPRKIGKATGREIDKLAQHLTALIGWNDLCADVDGSVFFLGLYHAYTFLGSFLGEASNIPTLMNFLYELQADLAEDSLTMKWHVFYKHCHEHEKMFGILHTTEPFEREHKQFMTSLHYQTTNAEKIMVTRYITKQIYSSKVREVADKLSYPIRAHFENSFKQGKLSVPVPTESSNTIPMSSIYEHHAQMVSNMRISGEYSLLKRTTVRSRMGTFVFSAPLYWKTTNTTMSIICYLDPMSGEVKFGSIELIISQPLMISLVVEEFEVESLVEVLKDYQCRTQKEMAYTNRTREMKNLHLLQPARIFQEDQDYLDSHRTPYSHPMPLREQLNDSNSWTTPKKPGRPITQISRRSDMNTPQNDEMNGENARESTSAVGQNLYKNLEASVNGNELDVFSAGSAIVNAYLYNEANVPDTILRFVKKYWRQATIPKMPTQLDVYNESYILTHGYGLLSQMGVYGNNMKTTPTTCSDVEQFQKLTGSRLNIKGIFNYPQEDPFSGAPIDLKLLPPSTQKAHIRLKNALCFVLRRSCSVPADIKNTDWSFPGDKTSRHLNPMPFPTKFYEELRDMFAEFFTISDEELDTPWKDEYGSLSCLSQYGTLAAKKSAFQTLASARNAYLVKTFHEEFRNAMSEIRHSSINEITGVWSNRKRGSARTALEMQKPMKFKVFNQPEAKKLSETKEMK